MTFNYSLFDRIELEATTTNKGRVYHTPAGDLRSVTTVLGDKLKKSKKLMEWRERVGASEADQITTQACSRGNYVHQMCEEYLMGNIEIGPHSELNGTRLMPSNLEMFLAIKPTLDENITCIYGVEFPLFSSKLRTAGRADGIVEWQNQNAILDFKTVRRPLDKDDERLAKYHLQVTVYAMMAEEMYGVLFPNNVIVVVPANGEYPQVFKRSNQKIRPFVERIFQ